MDRFLNSVYLHSLNNPKSIIMMYISISLTLLAMTAGAHLLAKSKTDNMGNFTKWIAYAVLVISIGMLLCELGRTGMRMMHRGEIGRAHV